MLYRLYDGEALIIYKASYFFVLEGIVELCGMSLGIGEYHTFGFQFPCILHSSPFASIRIDLPSIDAIPIKSDFLHLLNGHVHFYYGHILVVNPLATVTFFNKMRVRFNIRMFDLDFESSALTPKFTIGSEDELYFCPSFQRLLEIVDQLSFTDYIYVFNSIRTKTAPTFERHHLLLSSLSLEKILVFDDVRFKNNIKTTVGIYHLGSVNEQLMFSLPKKRDRIELDITQIAQISVWYELPNSVLPIGHKQLSTSYQISSLTPSVYYVWSTIPSVTSPMVMVLEFVNDKFLVIYKHRDFIPGELFLQKI
jgi:hypothetical protein